MRQFRNVASSPQNHTNKPRDLINVVELWTDHPTRCNCTLARANFHQPDSFCQRAVGNQPQSENQRSGLPASPAVRQPVSQPASKPASLPANRPANHPASQPAGHKPASQPAWLVSPPTNWMGNQAEPINQPVPSQVCHLGTDLAVNKFPFFGKEQSPNHKHFEGPQQKSITDTKAI